MELVRRMCTYGGWLPVLHDRRNNTITIYGSLRRNGCIWFPSATSHLKINKIVSVMTTGHLKVDEEAVPQTSCISHIPDTVDNVQHKTGIMENGCVGNIITR